MTKSLRFHTIFIRLLPVGQLPKMNNNENRMPDDLSPEISFSYEKPGYKCVWTFDSLEDRYCRVDRKLFTDKGTGRIFDVPKISNPRLRWIDIPGGIFSSRTAGYQITANYRAQSVVLLDSSDKISRRYDTSNAQAVCRGEQNLLKVALASLLLARSGEDLRRTYFEVFDRYGSDMFDSFPWPKGVL